MNFGLPYMGSKSKIIARIAEKFPKAGNFYDLFGGGGSVTHFMAKLYPDKFDRFHYNEIQHHIAQCFSDAIGGKYSEEKFKSNFIEPEEFHEKKDIDGYVATIWSFGNNAGQSYLFGKGIVNEKRSMHNAVVFDNFDDWFKSTFKIDSFPDGLCRKGRRLFLKKRLREVYPDCGERYVVNGKSLKQLEQLERLEQLQQLEQLKRFERISITSKDYREIEIVADSVVYCDIPYRHTGEYSKEGFDHESFFNWASSRNFAVYISEYNIDDKRFELIGEWDKRSCFNNNREKALIKKERLYCNAFAKLLAR